MASAAGYVAGHVYNPGMELGAAFDKAVADHIWAPLSMTDSTFSFAVAEGGKQLVSKDSLFASRARGVPTGENQWYGMGLEEKSRYGVPVIHHGGDLLGFHSDMMWVPSAEAGAVIMANSDDGVALRGPLLRRMLEVLYDGRPEAEAEIKVAVARSKGKMASMRGRITLLADAAAAVLASRYRNKDLGTLDVDRSGGVTRFSFCRLGAATWAAAATPLAPPASSAARRA